MQERSMDRIEAGPHLVAGEALLLKVPLPKPGLVDADRLCFKVFPDKPRAWIRSAISTPDWNVAAGSGWWRLSHRLRSGRRLTDRDRGLSCLALFSNDGEASFNRRDSPDLFEARMMYAMQKGFRITALLVRPSGL